MVWWQYWLPKVFPGASAFLGTLENNTPALKRVEPVINASFELLHANHENARLVTPIFFLETSLPLV